MASTLTQASKRDKHESDSPITRLQDARGKIDVVIGIPTWKGSLHPTTQHALEQLIYHNIQMNCQVTVHKAIGSIIWENRNKIIRDAIEIEAPYIFFMDTDMVFPPDIIQRLMLHNKPVVSTMAFNKTPPFAPNFYKRVASDGWIPITKFKKGEMIQVDCVGGAMMLVQTDAVAKIDPPWFSAPPMAWHVIWEEVQKLWDTKEDQKQIVENIINLWRKHGHLQNSIGEDYFFSEILRRAGVPIWVDTSISIGHVGDYMFSYDDFAAAVAEGAFDRKEALYDS